MNFLSSQPFSKMCQSRPLMNATSEPGRMRTYSVPFAAVRVKRGSTTISAALLRSLACRMCCIATGCASAGLDPIRIIAFEKCMSL